MMASTLRGCGGGVLVLWWATLLLCSSSTTSSSASTSSSTAFVHQHPSSPLTNTKALPYTSKRSHHRATVTMRQGEEAMSRQGLLQTALVALTTAAALVQAPVRPVLAEDKITKGEVTDKVVMDVSIAGKSVGTLTFGLYTKQAPKTTKNFLMLVDGKGSESYDYSFIWRVQKGKCLDMGRIVGGGGKRIEKNINPSGYMRLSSSNAADWTRNLDANYLSHDRPFLLSGKKGGGTFEFSLTLAADPKLDKENLVFGELVSGQDVIDEILKVRVSKEDPLGSKTVFNTVGQNFDPRAKLTYLNKPLQKIIVKSPRRV